MKVKTKSKIKIGTQVECRIDVICNTNKQRQNCDTIKQYKKLQ